MTREAAAEAVTLANDLHMVTIYGLAAILDLADPAQFDLATVLAAEPETYRQEYLDHQRHRISRRDRRIIGEITLKGDPER